MLQNYWKHQKVAKKLPTVQNNLVALYQEKEESISDPYAQVIKIKEGAVKPDIYYASVKIQDHQESRKADLESMVSSSNSTSAKSSIEEIMSEAKITDNKEDKIVDIKPLEISSREELALKKICTQYVKIITNLVILDNHF